MKAFYSNSKKRGTPPGTMVYTGDKTSQPLRISVLNYSDDHLDERELPDAKACVLYKEMPTASWINVDGLSQIDVVEELGTLFDLHPLTIEDILHTSQRPKIDDSEKTVFLVVRMLSLDGEGDKLNAEQVSLILTKNTLLTFQEVPGDVFDMIRERIRKKQGRIRSRGVDYLLYSLLDAIIDNYFLVLEYIGERIEDIESALLADPDPSLLIELYGLKRELLNIRKSVWPLREMVGQLERGENDLFDPGTRIFLHDLYDHVIQVNDTIESFREMLSGVHDLYLSSMGNKSNQVMKVLTIIATLFIPLTFVAGIYGMNFEHMPELHWRYGYPLVWAVMIGMTLSMLLYFRRKKWF